jgi:uncharacterized protein (DUF2267 family)
MDAPHFVKRVAELTGFDRDRSELLVRTTLVTLGTRISAGEADDLAAQLPDALRAVPVSAEGVRTARRPDLAACERAGRAGDPGGLHGFGGGCERG